MKLLTVRKGNFGPQTGSIIEIVSAHAFTYICIYYIQYIQYIQYIKLPDTHYLEPEYLGSIWELGIPKYFECLVFTRSSIQNIVYFMGFIYLGSYNITKTPGSIYHEPHPLDSGLEAEIYQPNPLWSHPTHFSGHYFFFLRTKASLLLPQATLSHKTPVWAITEKWKQGICSWEILLLHVLGNFEKIESLFMHLPTFFL